MIISLLLWILVFAASLYVLIEASGYFTDTAERIGLAFGIPDFVVGITIVAVGTSLPELVSSILAVLEGSSEIVIGNVAGSNVFNTVAVMGIPALIGRLVLPGSIVVFGLPMLVVASLLFFFMTQDKEITQWDVWLLLVFYVLYIGGLFR